MITLKSGDLFSANVEALVNAVNCVGVMGAGIALKFKELYPANFNAYKTACDLQEIDIGKMFVVPVQEHDNPKWIVNFPTKQHYRSPSRIAWIDHGLYDLVRVIKDYRIKSIAMPRIGCGYGGLDWGDVQFLIMQHLEPLHDVQIDLYSLE